MYAHVYTYIYIYISKCVLHCVILRVNIYITQATPKFTKPTWREQVHRDVNIPPSHPNQTPKFTKHTWHEQVHRDLNIPPLPTPPKPRSSRNIHDVSKFTGTLTFPPSHPTQTPKFTKHTWREQVHRDFNIPPLPPQPNPEVHEAYTTWASSQGL